VTAAEYQQRQQSEPRESSSGRTRVTCQYVENLPHYDRSVTVAALIRRSRRDQLDITREDGLGERTIENENVLCML